MAEFTDTQMWKTEKQQWQMNETDAQASRDELLFFSNDLVFQRLLTLPNYYWRN